ncbi:NTP pyrophosphatase (non-canonical NTP hydrolase) [Bradyrhizobium sp. JR4.1]|uniref:nucleoside triphosphate pyrophosphohydrolase family protein n=1 Tax=Bradyrhizobium sp. JR4.1 TaxID=3156372 RepID=UPI00339828B2
MTGEQTFLLREYASGVRSTDRFRSDEIQPIVLGLFGEVGSVMAAVKKHKREGEAFPEFKESVEEEFGDALWYFTALCLRLQFDIEDIFATVTKGPQYSTVIAATNVPGWPVCELASIGTMPSLDDVLLGLGQAASDLLTIEQGRSESREKLIAFVDSFLKTLQASDVSFAKVATFNLAKTRGRFLAPAECWLPTFDSKFSLDEQLPQEFEIVIRERKSGQSCLQWNGVFIGDPLTDNIEDRDGYRFHDVFHFAHAAVLHWSPTFRALIKHKRKSDPIVDEAQDSGRAIVVEEGLSAFIFSRAKHLNFFEGQTGVSFDLLKTIKQFVSGYEVQACPLKLWELTILQGYDVFRQVRSNKGGVIIGSRTARRITYKPL